MLNSKKPRILDNMWLFAVVKHKKRRLWNQKIILHLTRCHERQFNDYN